MCYCPFVGNQGSFLSKWLSFQACILQRHLDQTRHFALDYQCLRDLSYTF